VTRTLLSELIVADTGPPPAAFPSWGSCCVRPTNMYPGTEPGWSVGVRAVSFTSGRPCLGHGYEIE
jgi:hypothetical protein